MNHFVYVWWVGLGLRSETEVCDTVLVREGIRRSEQGKPTCSSLAPNAHLPSPASAIRYSVACSAVKGLGRSTVAFVHFRSGVSVAAAVVVAVVAVVAAAVVVVVAAASSGLPCVD